MIAMQQDTRTRLEALANNEYGSDMDATIRCLLGLWHTSAGTMNRKCMDCIRLGPDCSRGTCALEIEAMIAEEERKASETNEGEYPEKGE